MTIARRVNERAGDNAKTLAARPGTFPRVPRLGPHAVLGLGALLVARGRVGLPAPGLGRLAAARGAGRGAALLYAWRDAGPASARAGARARDRRSTRRGSRCTSRLDVTGDKDASVVFRWQGNGLARRATTRARSTRSARCSCSRSRRGSAAGRRETANAILMIPFQLATVAAIWATRTRVRAVACGVRRALAAERVLWEFKFDLVPAALLAVGAGARLPRNRWALSGVVLGARRARQVDAGARGGRARRVAARVSARARARRRTRAAFAAVVLLVYAAVSRLGARPGARRVLAPERALDHARVDVVPPAAPVRPRARAHAHLVLCRRARAGRTRSRSRLQVGLLLALVVGAVVVRGTPARSGRARRPGARGLPAHEPDLQPAVRDRPLRRVGGGGGARRRHASRAARGRRRGGARQRARTRSSTRSRFRTTRRRG